MQAQKKATVTSVAVTSETVNNETVNSVTAKNETVKRVTVDSVAVTVVQPSTVQASTGYQRRECFDGTTMESATIQSVIVVGPGSHHHPGMIAVKPVTVNNATIDRRIVTYCSSATFDSVTIITAVAAGDCNDQESNDKKCNRREYNRRRSNSVTVNMATITDLAAKIVTHSQQQLIKKN